LASLGFSGTRAAASTIAQKRSCEDSVVFAPRADAGSALDGVDLQATRPLSASKPTAKSQRIGERGHTVNWLVTVVPCEAKSMPFTLFCHQGSPDEALQFLREHGAALEGDGATWKTSFAMRGGKLEFNYDREWCSAPNWPRQLAGMANYLRQFEMTDETRSQVMVLIRRFEYSIGIVTDPEVTTGDDDRLEPIHALAEQLGAVIFTPVALLDSRFRAFAAADGDVDQEAEIPWGRAGAPSPSDSADDESERDSEEDFEPPTPERVAQRLYALTAVVARALFEMNVREGREPAYTLQQLRRWVDELELDRELEAHEREILSAPQGDLEPQQVIDSVWRIEGVAILAWALNLAPWPPYDSQVEVDDLLGAIRFLDPARCQRVLSDPSLRAKPELEKCDAQLLAYHWRMVDFRLRPTATKFDEVAIFGGPFDLSWAKLEGGDLVLQGKPISAADRGIVGLCSSISVERFTAANWLIGLDPIYSETPTDT
jgi:hypothetical protein